MIFLMQFSAFPLSVLTYLSQVRGFPFLPGLGRLISIYCFTNGRGN